MDHPPIAEFTKKQSRLTRTLRKNVALLIIAPMISFCFVYTYLTHQKTMKVMNEVSVIETETKKELSSLHNDLKQQFSSVRDEFSSIDSELDSRIHQVHDEIEKLNTRSKAVSSKPALRRKTQKRNGTK